MRLKTAKTSIERSEQFAELLKTHKEIEPIGPSKVFVQLLKNPRYKNYGDILGKNRTLQKYFSAIEITKEV